MKLPWQKERQPLRSAYSDYEPLISDRRMQAIAAILTEQYRKHGLPDGSDFVTFIQPKQVVDRGDGIHAPIPEVGVFAVISDNPRAANHRLMTQASVWLKDWLATDAARLHFVSGPDDPALPIFKAAMRSHLDHLKNLRAMI